MQLLALINTNRCCIAVPPDDCEPSQSSFVGGDKGDGVTVSAGVATPPTSVAGTGNDLAAILTGLAATILLFVALLTVACFWRRRRCISLVGKRC